MYTKGAFRFLKAISDDFSCNVSQHGHKAVAYRENNYLGYKKMLSFVQI
jgi:hypothetical protein